MNQPRITPSRQRSPLLWIGLACLCALGGWLLWPGCQQHQLKKEPTAEPTPRDATSTEQTADRKSRPEARPTERSSDARPPDASAGLWSTDAPIDIHAHIGSFTGYDLSTPTLMSNIKKYGIRWALISNIDGANLSSTKNISEDLANQATIAAVRKHPNALRGIYWTRPNKGISAQASSVIQTTLSATDKRKLFVAMKFHPDMNQFPADSSKLDPYMKLCQRHQLVAVFHSGQAGTNADPAKIYALARRYPKVPVVLYHMGFFGPHSSSISVAAMAKARGDARLYLGTAQADPKAVIQAVKTVGSGYVMFGTDAAYYAPDHYARYKTLVATLRRDLSASDFAAVMKGNARRLFLLP